MLAMKSYRPIADPLASAPSAATTVDVSYEEFLVHKFSIKKRTQKNTDKALYTSKQTHTIYSILNLAIFTC